MTAVAKYVKTAAEIKRYTIDYKDWLDTGETLTSMLFTVMGDPTVPPLTIPAFVISTDGKSVGYFVQGGLNAKQYEVKVQATTSIPQVKEDCILFVIKDC